MEFKPSEIYLVAGVTDLRLGIDGYAHIVQTEFKLDPLTDRMFLFCNKSHNKLKILYWDKTGFWLLYKRLEKGTFKYPRQEDGAVVLSEQQLRWLLEGLSIDQKRAFRNLDCKYC